MLRDGYDNRHSTNGTWYIYLFAIYVRLYLNEDYEIYNGMLFKANQTLFQVNTY